MVYVTHDQEEAMTLGQRIAVLRDGRIEQVDGPARLYNQPATTFVAQFTAGSYFSATSSSPVARFNV